MKKHSILPLLITAFFLVGCGDEKPEVLIASAKNSLAKNDYKTAIIQMKNALQSNSDLPEARFLLGSALLGQGDFSAAEIEFDKARNLKYSDDLLVPQLAKIWLAQGKFKKISEEFSTIELFTPASIASLQISLSNAYAAQGMKEQAKKALDTALRVDPDNADALMVKVKSLAAGNDIPAAVALIDDVITKTPNNPEALKLKGDIIFFGKKDIDGALIQYKKSVEAKPNFLQGYIGIISILLQKDNFDEAAKQIEALKKFAAGNAQTKYLETQLAYQKKDFKSARDLSQQLLKMAPDNSKVLQLAGAIEYQLNSFVQAEVYLNKAVAAVPSFQLARRLLTLTYLRTGQPSKAWATLSPVLEKDPVDPSLFSIAGEIFLQNGDVKKASEYFSKASKLDPQDARKRTALAMTHMMGGDTELAFNELRDISMTDKGVMADMALISVYFRRQEFDKAFKAIDGFEKKQPKNPLVWILRGRIQLAQNNISAARKNFNAALDLNPSYLPALKSLAALDVSEKKPDDAKKRFENVLVREPSNVQALLSLAQLQALTGGKKEEVVKLLEKAISANPSDVEPHVLLVDLHLRLKDYKAAFSVAQNAASVLPNNPEILNALGRSQQALGETNQALSTYGKLATIQSSSPQPFLRMADVNFSAKNKDAAVQNLNKALELKPDLLEAQRSLVLLHISSEKYQDAINVARLVQRQRPKEVFGYMLEADVDVAQKKWNEAVLVYRTALKETTSLEPAIKLHAALIASSNKSDADKFSTAWMKDHPKDVNFVLYMADNALLKKDFLAADGFYSSVVKIQPNNSIAYNNMAWIAGQLKKDTALSYAEKANKITPNQPAFMDTMAMLLAEKGDYVKALELQNQVITLQPGNYFFKMNLAKIYIKSGEKPKAKAVLSDLAKLGDKFSGHAEVNDMLKNL